MSESVLPLVETLLTYIFKKEHEQINKFISHIVKKNSALGGSPDGFYYEGTFHSDLMLSIQYKGQKGPIHPSLVPEMEKHIEELKTIKFDKERIKQALIILLRDCRSPQDIRDALPNSLIDAVGFYQNLNRTRPEAFTLANSDNPIKIVQYKQYKEIRDKIQYYIALKLLY